MLVTDCDSYPRFYVFQCFTGPWNLRYMQTGPGLPLQILWPGPKLIDASDRFLRECDLPWYYRRVTDPETIAVIRNIVKDYTVTGEQDAGH